MQLFKVVLPYQATFMHPLTIGGGYVMYSSRPPAVRYPSVNTGTYFARRGISLLNGGIPKELATNMFMTKFIRSEKAE